MDPLHAFWGETLNQGVDPQDYLRQVASQLEQLENQQQIEAVPGELEYLFDLIDPALQDRASQLIGRLRAELKSGR